MSDPALLGGVWRRRWWQQRSSRFSTSMELITKPNCCEPRGGGGGSPTSALFNDPPSQPPCLVFHLVLVLCKPSFFSISFVCRLLQISQNSFSTNIDLAFCYTGNIFLVHRTCWRFVYPIFALFTAVFLSMNNSCNTKKVLTWSEKLREEVFNHQ